MVKIFNKGKSDNLSEDKNDNIKYKKPKIILLDLDKSSTEILKKEGFNVTSGTLGSKYKVEKTTDYCQIYFDSKLPNLNEQEIVCIDINGNKTLDDSKTVDTPPEKKQYWGECSNGIIDPAPILMKQFETSFKRILNHGGLFIIFASRKIYPNIIFGSKQGYSLDGDKEKLHNWSFLPFFEGGYYDFKTKNDYGEEIYINPQLKENDLKKLLKKHATCMNYEITFKLGNGVEKGWKPLLLNKYDDIVGGIFSPETGGEIVILPQSSKKDEIIHELMTNIIPTIKPSLFPEMENKSWIHNDEYEFENVKKYKSDIEKVQKETKQKINDLNDKIKEEHDQWEFLNNIITETDKKLVMSVIECLKFIGFKNIKDVDEEIGESSDNSRIKEEDIQICDNSTKLLLEVKGIGGNPTDEDLLQVHKYVPRKMRKWKHTDVNGCSVINFQRNISPLDRNEFTEKQIEDAENHEIKLINTWDLYILIRGMIKYEWEGKVIRDLFYTNEGKMNNIPSNYKKIGKITHVFSDKNVIVIKIESEKLRQGDKIGYLKGHEFFEYRINSMQINKKIIEEGNIGDEVGIKIDSAKNNLKNIKLYKVIS
ncbi:hypothetical protein SDC9_07609 [bioreactor metagenome]|uniref:Uncharacterized protein n=1 Tax=bioreactor metagenome TaxID=1076179 RepID=A0A644T5H3_9ZZZZ|nr:hypothetical protein [Methanobrevibacter sp.]MEA4957729.1 hypothetical protein [Methanobrevibacter sp.]